MAMPHSYLKSAQEILEVRRASADWAIERNILSFVDPLPTMSTPNVDMNNSTPRAAKLGSRMGDFLVEVTACKESRAAFPIDTSGRARPCSSCSKTQQRLKGRVAND